MDGRGVRAFYIAVGKLHFRCMNTLLWLNTDIAVPKVVKMLQSEATNRLLPILDDWLQFIHDFEQSKHVLTQCFNNTISSGTLHSTSDEHTERREDHSKRTIEHSELKAGNANDNKDIINDSRGDGWHLCGDPNLIIPEDCVHVISEFVLPYNR